MTKTSIIKSIQNRLNNNDKKAYIKYKVNPPSMSQYFPDNWNLILLDENVDKSYDIKRQESFEVDSYEEGVSIIEDIKNDLIKNKVVKCEENKDSEYYVIIQWN